MTDVEAGQGTDTRVVSRWRPLLETVALILLAALLVSIVGGIVGAVFQPGADGWRKLSALGVNEVETWHVAVLVIAVGLVFALRVPFPPDARGASIARLVLLGALVLGAVVALCAFLGIIGFIGLDIFGVTNPQKVGEILVLLGGGAVAGAVALLALRGQSLVPAPVRTPAPPAAAPTAAAPGGPGWGADPFGRHQWRYWDGNRWTDQVADGSTQSTDPAS
jgi:hypothetical protein